MIEIHGNYGYAKVFTDALETSAGGLIRAFCDQPFSADSKIRIMPDVHAGKGCTIGTTMTVKDKVVPNIVGVDIGCGMLTVKLKDKRVDLPALDSFIRQNIPYGRDVRERSHRSHGRMDLSDLRCVKKIDTRRAKESIGTLGGGNHFIEIDKDEEGGLYLVIHTGSRNPGLRVAEYYQKIAYQACGGKAQNEIPYELAYQDFATGVFSQQNLVKSGFFGRLLYFSSKDCFSSIICSSKYFKTTRTILRSVS